jgi:lipopolysaccharide/colanic/teichoic acid biosynthesis glycosyltransferase
MSEAGAAVQTLDKPHHPLDAGDDSIRPVQPAAGHNAFWKRALDVTISSGVLVLGSPIILVVALLVKCTSRGPLVYKGKRVGLGGKIFYMYKFRSMYTDADARLKEVWAQNDNDGPIFKIKNDPRVTPVGKVIRKLSLDELPQFVNVLKGEMSIVGPRALHVYEVCEFDDFARGRMRVKPGITCYWQISGRSDISFEEWMKLDNQYVEDMSLGTDLKIIAKTPKVVLFGQGAY